jgi:hypothetical protein
MHRAIISLMEELEAVDWYNQRVDACMPRWCLNGSGGAMHDSIRN